MILIKSLERHYQPAFAVWQVLTRLNDQSGRLSNKPKGIVFKSN
jgi:hypothetical protein